MPSERVNSQPIAPPGVAGDAPRSGLRSTLGAVVGVACLADPAAARPIPDAPTGPVFGPMLSFVGTSLLNLVVGGLVVAVAPRFSRAVVDRIRSQPVESFLYGVLTYVAVFVAAFLLAITVVGIVVVIPGIVVLAVVGVAANLLAVVAVGAVVVSLLTTVPGLGDLVNVVLGTLGMGAVAGRYWENR